MRPTIKDSPTNGLPEPDDNHLLIFLRRALGCPTDGGHFTTPLSSIQGEGVSNFEVSAVRDWFSALSKCSRILLSYYLGKYERLRSNIGPTLTLSPHEFGHSRWNHMNAFNQGLGRNVHSAHRVGAGRDSNTAAKEVRYLGRMW